LTEPGLPRPGRVEQAIGGALLHTRWAILPALLAMLVMPLLIGAQSVLTVWGLVEAFPEIPRTRLVIETLKLVDLALVASLVLMVVLSVFDETVSRIAARHGRPRWLGAVSSRDLKLNIVLLVVAIATLELFADWIAIAGLDDRVLAWRAGLYGLFLLALLVVTPLARTRPPE
jgi:uncharacterized protein (TIGR00645 family)